MLTAPPSDGSGSSTRPYLIRALHDWCTDNGFTPYLAVFVDERVQVPAEFVKNQEIVLNASFEATSGLELGNEDIRFRARFGGVPRDIIVPVDHVIAIYARENGQGMAFPAPSEPATGQPAPAEPAAGEASPPGAAAAPTLQLAPRAGAKPPALGPEDPPPSGPAGGGARPALKRIK